jgi:hypothetical protein
MPALAEWDSFYVIVGSAAGALIGLQFVVITLISGRPRTAEAGTAFSTPTIVHFSVVLLLSALLRAPWDAVATVAVAWGLIGLAGIAYILLTAWRMRVQSSYKPDFEDWLFHVLLPLAAYAVLAVSALVSPAHAKEVLFAVGGVTLLLLFSGIHNAWDAASYLVVRKPDDQGQGQD